MDNTVINEIIQEMLDSIIFKNNIYLEEIKQSPEDDDISVYEKDIDGLLNDDIIIYEKDIDGLLNDDITVYEEIKKYHDDFLYYCKINDYDNCKRLLQIDPELVHCKNQDDENGLFLLLINYNTIPSLELIKLLLMNQIDIVCKTKHKSSILFALIIGLSDMDYSTRYIEILYYLIKWNVDIYEIDQTEPSTTFIDFCQSLLSPGIIDDIKFKHYLKKIEQ